MLYQIDVMLSYMGKIGVGEDGNHGGNAGTDSVGGRGHPRGLAGTVPARRGRRGKDSPACPVAATQRLGHGTGSWGSGSPLPYGATAGGLVPAWRDAEVCARHGGGHGQPSWLAPEQEAAVVEETAKGTFTTAADVRRWVAEQFRVTYRPKGVYGLLRRVRCQPKVPRLILTHIPRRTRKLRKVGKGDCGRSFSAGRGAWPGPMKCGGCSAW
jgi:hypothetical protein